MSIPSIFRRLSLLVALMAGVVALTASSNTEARVPDGPRLDSTSVGCGQLQDQYDQGVRDLANASKHGTQAQWDAAFAHLKSIIGLWNGSPCQASFGSLIFRKAPIAGVTGIQGSPTLAASGGVSPPKVVKTPKPLLRSVLKKS